MHNDLFTIGPFTVHGYGLMTAIGILAAYFLMEYLAKKKRMDHERIFWLLIWCLVFGYLGSKVLYFITVLPKIVNDPSLIKESLMNGWVMYGGLLGGILGGHLYCRYKKLNSWAYFDIGLTAVVLAQAFGRIGCFLAGCCYGAQTTGSFCIVFTESSYAPNNVPLIPTQLIMSAGDFILFAFLMIYDRHKKNEGQITGAYLTLYSLGRFAVEFFRGDVERGQVGPLSTSQFIALFVAAIGIVIWILRTRSRDGLFKPAEKEITAETEEKEETPKDTAETAEEAAEAAAEAIEEAAEEAEETAEEAARDTAETIEEAAEEVSETAEEAAEEAEETAEKTAEAAAETAEEAVKETAEKADILP